MLFLYLDASIIHFVMSSLSLRRQRYWARSMIGYPLLCEAVPATGHLALACMERFLHVFFFSSPFPYKVFCFFSLEVLLVAVSHVHVLCTWTTPTSLPHVASDGLGFASHWLWHILA